MPSPSSNRGRSDSDSTAVQLTSVRGETRALSDMVSRKNMDTLA